MKRKFKKQSTPPGVTQAPGSRNGGALAGATLPGSDKWATARRRPGVSQTPGPRDGCALAGATLPGSVKPATAKKKKRKRKERKRGVRRNSARRRGLRGENLRIGTANVGSMSGRSGEVVNMLKKKRLDFCALQETRWKGSGTEVMGGHKFFWQGGKGGAGVGVMIAKKWVDSVLEVKRVNDRMMVVRVNVGKWVLNLVCVYAPQVGRPMGEKETFYLGLAKIVGDLGNKRGEMTVICGDFNGHVGEKVEGYVGVHGGKGFGSRNAEGEMLLEFAGAHELAVMNTWFDKNDLRKISYESGRNQTVVDYVLVGQKDKAAVTDVTVIRNEPCLLQHKLMVCCLMVGRWMPKKRTIFVPKTKIYKLRQPSVLGEFQRRLSEKAKDGNVGAADVEGKWAEIKDCYTDVANEVCGQSKGPPRHQETWWWNEECDKAVKEKQRLYDATLKLGKGVPNEKSKMAKNAYQRANKASRKVIGNAKESASKLWCKLLESGHGTGEACRVVKQMVKRNRDVTGAGCVRDGNGKLVMEEGELREVWRSHYEKLSNEEFDWDKDSLGETQMVSGPIQEISKQEVRAAVMKMKCNKAPGPTGLGTEVLKAAGEDCIDRMTDLCNAVINEGRMPKDWDKSLMINVYKGKGDALECGSYRGIKLLEHAMKVFERVIEARLRQKIHIDDMQFGFTPGKGTTDAVFMVRQLQEKYLGKKRGLWMAFIDLEKAFDRVPRDVIWWALRELGVEEHVVSVIQVMYARASTAVKVGAGESGEFEVKVGVHQGSVLSPLLFIAVLEALSRRFREGLPFELLYADDLVLIAETEEELLGKIRVWKKGMEAKGLRVNMAKTKILECHVGSGVGGSSGKWPCGVCRKGVGSNSIQCSKCTKWIHKKCSGVKGKLKADPTFQCKSCVSGTQFERIIEHKEVDMGEDGKIELVEQFCYLGDMIGAGGGAEDAVRCRIRCAWGKFNEVASMLTKRGLSLKRKGALYNLYVRKVLVYGSETWPMKVGDVQRMVRTERSMVRRMCGVSLKDKRRSADLLKLLCIVGVEEVMDSSALRWFGHVERKDVFDWVSGCRNLVVDGEVSRGRNRKTWGDRVDGLLEKSGLRVDEAADRDGWRREIAPVLPVCSGVQTRAASRR